MISDDLRAEAIAALRCEADAFMRIGIALVNEDTAVEVHEAIEASPEAYALGAEAIDAVIEAYGYDQEPHVDLLEAACLLEDGWEPGGAWDVHRVGPGPRIPVVSPVPRYWAVRETLVEEGRITAPFEDDVHAVAHVVYLNNAARTPDTYGWVDTLHDLTRECWVIVDAAVQP